MGRHGHEEEPPVLTDVRLDVWLDVACLYPTRSQAATACAGGKVDVNGHAATAHRRIHVGDRLSVTFALGKRSFVVKALLDKHVKKAEARALYEETTPPLSPEVLEARRLERLLAPREDAKGSGRPTKKQRRDRERTRGW